MARVRYSPLIAEISGSVGNATFQNGTWGAVLRQKPFKRYKLTEARVQVTSRIAIVQAAWRAMTDAQHRVWNNLYQFIPVFAKNNRNITLSGYQLFLKWNLERLASGMDVSSEAQFNALFEPAQDSIELAFVAGLKFRIDTTFATDQTWGVLKLTPPLNAYEMFPYSKLRVIQLDTALTGEWDITDAYGETFGTIAVNGDRVYCELSNFWSWHPAFYETYRLHLTVA